MKHANNAVDGLLLLNKPHGITSNKALQVVKRLLQAKKAGHTGSLDPAATGMLPLCFGEATKVCAFLLDADKTYRVTACLGTATDTGDADGELTQSADVPDLSFQDWQAILGEFVGDTLQVPPMYSALKKDGRRLYELARQGRVVEREARPITIRKIALLESAGSRLVFRVRCTKGTYIRSLVEDIARRADTVAHTAWLHRESVGRFREADLLDLPAIEALAGHGPAALRERLLPPDIALAGFPTVNLETTAGQRFVAGQVFSLVGEKRTGLARVYVDEGRFLGIGELLADGRLAPRRVFQMQEKSP